MVSPDPARIEQLRSDLLGHPEWGADLVYGTCDTQTLLLNLHRYEVGCFLIDLALGIGVAGDLVTMLSQAGYQAFIFLGAEGTIPDLPGEILPAGAPTGSILAAVARLAVRHDGSEAPQFGPGARGRPIVITVHSPKGGSGKTLCAICLAVQYAARGVRTLLVDLALYGGVAPSLGLPRRDRGLGRVLEAIEQDPAVVATPELGEILRENLTPFPTGEHRLDILLGGPPLKVSKLNLEQTDAILQWLRGNPYEVVVIDTSSEIAERTTAAMRAADHLLILMTPELSAAWAVLGMQDLLRNLSSAGKIQVALNRSLPGFRPKELEEIIGYPVVAQIPEVADPWEKAAGRDLRLDYSAFGMAFKRLAQQFRTIYSAIAIPSIRR